MLRVMKKDLILSRKILLVNGGIFAVFLAYFAVGVSDMTPGTFAGFGSFMLAFLPVGMVVREDKFNAMTLQCSLPVNRRKVVQARFVLSEGMALLGLFAVLLMGGVIPFSHFHPSDLFSFTPILTGLTLITLVLSFLLPFSLRFGAKGLMIFMVGAQVLGVVLLTIVMATNSSIDRRIVDGIINFFVRAHEVLGGPGFNISLLGFLVLIYCLSYLVSIRVFENREL